MSDPPIAILFPDGRIETFPHYINYGLTDGRLALISPGGGRLTYQPGEWAAVGSLEDADATPWLAIEETA